MSDLVIGVLPFDLLRAHVLGRPDERPGPGDALPGERPGDAKVHDPGVAVLVEHDVLGLEVAMDDPQLDGLPSEPFADLAGDRDRLTRAQPPDLADELAEVLARGHTPW